MYNSSRGILYSAPPDEEGERKLDSEESPDETAEAADEPAVEDIDPVAIGAESAEAPADD